MTYQEVEDYLYNILWMNTGASKATCRQVAKTIAADLITVGVLKLKEQS